MYGPNFRGGRDTVLVNYFDSKDGYECPFLSSLCTSLNSIADVLLMNVKGFIK